MPKRTINQCRSFRLIVPGEAVPKGRPRAVRRGAFIAMHTPQKTERYEHLVKLAAQAENAPMLEGPIQAQMAFHFCRPKSAPKWKAWKDTRPDVENLAKAVMDGLNGIAYRDDGQIVRLFCEKAYAGRSEVAIELTELPEG